MVIGRVPTSDSRHQLQLYETNLLSLFLFRAAQDSSIERFESQTNIESLETLRFKIKEKGRDEAGTVFVQVLHKTKKKQLEIDVAEYYNSYNQIKHIIDESELLFVIYTNANVDQQFTDTWARSGLSAKLNDILDTGGKVKSLKNEENLKSLTNKIVKDQITSLAKTIATYMDDKLYCQMMSDELVQRYHVILAQKVIDITAIQPLEREETSPYRIASFRQDFFDNTEEYIVLFRDKLYSDIIKGRTLEFAEIQLYLSEFLNDPTDATRLSKLIGTGLTYNHGQLEFDKQSTEAFRPNMKPLEVPRATFNKAVELAAVEILSVVKFKVPAAFGNQDLTISGSDAEIEKRICYLASTMKELLDKCDESKIVTVDESLGDVFLELDGGVAGAIGNVFVFDDNTKYMKITDNWESLNTLAQRLYIKLTDVIHNLHEYSFCFKVDKFPELLFDSYGEKMATDFLNNLLIYYNQAGENDVQQILKSEIEDIQRNETNYFQIKSDAILLRYHNEIQKWRMHQHRGPQDQESINLFRQSIDEVLDKSLISLISGPYNNKIKQYDYTFTEDAVKSLKLPDRPSSTILVTENCVLTAVKVLQYLKGEEQPYVVLDVEYIASLPANDQNALRAELKDANQKDVLIIICDKVDNSHEKTLENIANTVRNKFTIVICNQKTLGILHKYFAEADNMLHDKKFSLIDVDIESQRRILNDAVAVFPGVEIRLGVFLRGWSRTGRHASAAARGTADVAAEDEADDRLLGTPDRTGGTVQCAETPAHHNASRARSFSKMSPTFESIAGTAATPGQLYKTKLISLIFYRAKYDDSIEQFRFASNKDSKEIEAFNDICFRAKVKGLSKPFFAFIKINLKDDSDDSSEIDLKKYLHSYIKVREKLISQDDTSSMFHGEFEDTECYFVIYMKGKERHSLDDGTVEDKYDLDKLNNLIATGGIAKRPFKHRADVAASLHEELAKDKIISLATHIATFIRREKSFRDLLSDKDNIILLYHVFLAQKVFDVSEIKPEGHRVATFRQNFFNTTDEYLTLFKDTLLQEILKRRTIEPGDVNNMLSDFIAEPTDVTKLSKLIVTVVTYNNGQLELVEKYSKYCKQQVNQVLILHSTVNEAVELALKDIVIKVPAAFGNKDLTLRGNDKKKQRRISHLKLKIIEILDKFKPNNLIVIDESIEEGLLELNGGLVGAIGNIFVPEHNTKYMKITDNCDALGPLAKSLYTKLVTDIHNLHEYRFYFAFKNVPRFSLGPSDYDKSLTRDFLNNLLFYSKQADEKEVERILKNKIKANQCDHLDYFQAKTDAIFIKYHDEIQKWWMTTKRGYLTKDSDIFEEAINTIINDRLMSSINLIYMSKIQDYEFKFPEDVAGSWHLQDHSTTVIITENSVLTVVKVLQHLKNKDHAVLDLEYIVNLPTTDIEELCAELTEANEHKALIFVCDKLRNKRNEIKTFEIIRKAVLKKITIIITNHVSFKTLEVYFPRAVSIVQDENNSLIDMSEVSQKSILETRVMFQDKGVSLDSLIDGEFKDM